MGFIARGDEHGKGPLLVDHAGLEYRDPRPMNRVVEQQEEIGEEQQNQ